MRSVPGPPWFLGMHVREVAERADILKAVCTSTYGTILKMDSTKKVVKKLAGADAHSAAWATSVGNERGELLNTVLTTSESLEALEPLAAGLIRRYRLAGKPPPAVLYADRDCCRVDSNRTKLHELFAEWPDLVVRLDAWHYMRRLARGVTSTAHPLYQEFMARLSACLFDWDTDDVARLQRAKRAELCAQGIEQPTDTAVLRTMTPKLLSRHCRRRTAGAQASHERIERLLVEMADVRDQRLGLPLFRPNIQEIWQEQRHHLTCLQDPVGVSLYTEVGELTVAGVKLPLFRCARGSTSLESYHLHLARFIPGESSLG